MIPLLSISKSLKLFISEKSHGPVVQLWYHQDGNTLKEFLDVYEFISELTILWIGNTRKWHSCLGLQGEKA